MKVLMISLSIFLFSCQSNETDWSRMEREAERTRVYKYEEVYQADSNLYLPVCKVKF